MVALDEVTLRQMVYGGAVLGGGGGGTIDAGLEAGRRALCNGKPRLVALEALHPDERIVTLSRVGTVGGEQAVDRLDGHDTQALRLFLKTGEQDVGGFVPSEVGPLAVTYGWTVSAATGIPVVDAPCNGRAHPLSVMGSLGLHRRPEHVTTTAAVGGHGNTGKYVQMVLRTNARQAAEIVRNTVAETGVPAAVVRNPLPSSYVGKHAAVGALAETRRVGEALLRHVGLGVASVLDTLSSIMEGRLLAEGFVKSVELAPKRGFTIGHIAMRSTAGRQLVIPVCNEYMMVLDGEQVSAAFPDLIAIFDVETALPLPSAEVRPAQQVAVFGVPRNKLMLASTMRDRSLLRGIEKLLQISFPWEGMQ